jgi:polysaccharide deacetylase 2 family uncharacterized protein YibQ
MARASLSLCAALSALCIAAVPASAAGADAGADAAADAPVNEQAHRPVIAIIVDDLGYRPDMDRRIVELPGAVTCAFLPHTPHAARLAGVAAASGKEIMLHLPMQALDQGRDADGMLHLGMTREEFVATVRDGLDFLPQVRGVNNHMGSLLTQSPLRMQWLMEEIKSRDGLYFVDSFTSLRSVAWRVAQTNRLPSARRDVFLDASRDPALIRAQFDTLLERARRNGFAVAIAHPYPETVAFLEQRLAALDEAGVELLPVSRLIERRTALREAPLVEDVARRDNGVLVPGEGSATERR